MAYPRNPTYVRDDPFGPTGHNNLLQRMDHLVGFLGTEHDPITGEHNTPHVARTLGHVAWSGAAYSLSGFNAYAKTVATPATGTVTIELEAEAFEKGDGIIEIQPASDTGGGDGKPWVTAAKWVSDVELQVFLKQNTAPLDDQQVFAATDGDFFIGIRSSARPTSRPGNATNRRVRGDGLAVSSSDWNPNIQKMGENRLAALAGHTAAGLHNVREVSKAWGMVRWTGSSYTMVAHQGLGAGLVHVSTGIVRVNLANCIPAISAPVQAFVRAVSASDGLAHVGLRCAMVPKSSCAAASVDVYLYESYIDVGPPVEYRWRRVDGDFFIRVHGA